MQIARNAFFIYGLSVMLFHLNMLQEFFFLFGCLLRQRDGKDAVFNLCADAHLVHVVGQDKSLLEFRVIELAAQVAALVFPAFHGRAFGFAVATAGVAFLVFLFFLHRDDEVVVFVVNIEVQVGVAVAIYGDAGFAVGAEGIGPGVGVAAQYDPILTLIRYNTESFQSLNHMCNKPTYLKPMRICFDEYFPHLFASFWTDSCNSQWEIG